MTVRIITPPTTEPVTLEEVKEHLRIDHDTEDALLRAKLGAARRHVENLTGLTLARATYEFSLDRFPRAEIEVPMAPLVSVESIHFVAADGSSVEVPGSAYVADTVSSRGWIVPHSAWPASMKTVNAVRIRFVAGYEPGEVPESLREAILQLAAWWYEHREAAVVEGSPQSVPFGVGDLVNEHREWTF